MEGHIGVRVWFSVEIYSRGNKWFNEVKWLAEIQSRRRGAKEGTFFTF